MTSVNSPACLLARNHFYRNTSSSPEPLKPVFSRQTDCSSRQRRVTVWVSMSTPPGVPAAVATKGLWVSVVLGSPSLSSICISASKPPRSAVRGVK